MIVIIGLVSGQWENDFIYMNISLPINLHLMYYLPVSALTTLSM